MSVLSIPRFLLLAVFHFNQYTHLFCISFKPIQHTFDIKYIYFTGIIHIFYRYLNLLFSAKRGSFGGQFRLILILLNIVNYSKFKLNGKLNSRSKLRPSRPVPVQSLISDNDSHDRGGSRFR
jgi:hypothetical protein